MAFRDELDALRARRDALLADCRRTDDPVVQAELEEVRAQIDARRRRLAQHVVNRTKLAARCPASWDGMVGGDSVRHCGLCDKNVYDFSGLTAMEATALIAKHEGNVCVRLWRRRDGTVLTADCEVGRRRRRSRGKALAAALAVTAAGAAVWAGREEPPTVRPILVPERGPAFDAELFLEGPPNAYWQPESSPCIDQKLCPVDYELVLGPELGMVGEPEVIE